MGPKIIATLYFFTAILLIVIVFFLEFIAVLFSGGQNAVDAFRRILFIFVAGTMAFGIVGFGIWTQRKWGYALGVLMGAIFLVVYITQGAVYTLMSQYASDIFIIVPIIAMPILFIYLFMRTLEPWD